ncbi:Osmolarity sensor protein EnvZ [Aquimixticola soesokkakensis]|uniref:histidine kinase n=1 Tax=Aquimixticola soesokkakensis TaxID=1519096 RepID=A0A1Y5SF37_9RHOB|nr:ATP-binding protein [Aquimixticola soesokkakensis]SLN39347.1 Osmolarity sensor protein EnvZ [Aquimixticola soesokkakensis]
MTFDWLKRYVPRGLYGRSALILLVPVVVLLIVVSVVFVQRHFEGVTRQLMIGVLAETEVYATVVGTAADPETAQSGLAELDRLIGFTTTLGAPEAVASARDWYDLSGRVITAMITAAGLAQSRYAQIAFVEGVDLKTNPRAVLFSFQTEKGRLTLSVPRGRTSASNPHQLLVLMILTGILMTAISGIFLRNQMRPIQRLARAAEEFGRGRITVYRPAGATEVRQAGTAFLDMRARIERQIEQRTMMLSGVSHDLRTPVTRMKLQLSMMPEDEDTEALAQDLRDMERLLEEFLAFARGDALDDPERVDPFALLEDIVARYDPQKVTLGALDGAQGGEVIIRPLAIERALQNLIGNALRYGKEARVSLAVTDKAVRFRIEDRGPGIAPERREEALKPFVRLDPARNQNAGSGVGLGLAIAADIARRHGGALRLGESADLGGLQVDLVLARSITG